MRRTQSAKQWLPGVLLLPLLAATFVIAAQPATPVAPVAPAASAAPATFTLSVALPEQLDAGRLELRPYPSARERALYFLRGEESKPIQSVAVGGDRRSAGFEVPFGFWLLTYRDAGGRRLETELTPLETPRDLGELRGAAGGWRLRVINTQGAPIAGARVGLLPFRIGQEAWRAALRPFETDKDGRVVLPRPQPRSELWVLAPGYQPLAAAYQLGDLPSQVRLAAKVSLPMLVVDARRRPLDGALLSNDAGQPLGFTDAAGLISGPFENGDLLWIEDAAGQRFRERVVRLRSGKLRLQVGRPSELTGEVVDRRAGGRAIPGALVWLNGRPETWRAAGADGEFELFDLAEERSGEVLVAAQAAGYSRALAPARDTALRLALDRADRVLLGRVIGDDGEPLAGALVEVVSRGRLATWSTRADEYGQYRLAGLPAGELWAEAMQPGYLPAVRPLHRSFAEVRLDFTLAVGSKISGRLISPRGEPLVAAALSLARSASEEPKPLGTTGKDGLFELGPFAAGQHRLILTAAGYARRELLIESNGIEPVELGDLELEDEEAWTGRVIDPDGEPLAEAAIFVWRGEDRRGLLLEWPVWRGPDATSGADGRFALAGLTAGEGIAIEVRAPGRPPIFEAGIVVGDSGERDFVVPLGAALEIEVVDLQREPLSGVEVTLARLGVDPFENWQTTDLDGKVAYPALAAGPFELRAASDSYGVYRRQIELAEGEDESLQIVLGEEGSTLEGRVFLPDGQPAAGLQVFVDTGEKISPPPVRARIDELGFYHLEGLPNGTVTVEVSGRSASYAPIFRRKLAIELPQHQLDIELPETSARELEIELVAEDGRPLEGIALTIYYKTKRGGGIVSLQARTNSEGLALFTDVPQTTYEVIAWAPDKSWRSAEARVRVDVPRKEHRMVMVQLPESEPLD